VGGVGEARKTTFPRSSGEDGEKAWYRVNFYKHHLGDYDGHTAHLTWDEDMAYTRLLRAYYRREKGIPDAEKYRLARAATKSHKAAVDRVLDEFFTLEGGDWRQKRCDEEIASYQEKAERNREIGKLGGRPKATRTVPTDNPEQTQMVPRNNPSQNQIPDTREKTSPDGPTVFDFAISILGEQGVKEKSARSFIGSLLKDWDSAEVEGALRSAVGKVDACAYIKGVLKDKPRKGQIAVKKVAL
jgi:uncharacterized protein YdaU (DUF1376 family)